MSIDSNLQRRAALLVAGEVHCCMSPLVASLAKAQGSRWRVIEEENIYGLTCQAFELAAPMLDYEGAAREAGWTRVAHSGMFCGPVGSPARLSDYDDWQQCCEANDIEPHELEVSEHWAVSSWLADKLEAKGARIDRDFAGLIVWARPKGAPSIQEDPVILAIAADETVADPCFAIVIEGGSVSTVVSSDPRMIGTHFITIDYDIAQSDADRTIAQSSGNPVPADVNDGVVEEARIPIGPADSYPTIGEDA